MPVTVERVVHPADLPTLASLHQAAFGPYPTHDLLWRDADPEAERRWLASIFAGPLKKPDEPMFKAVDEDGRVVGFALWKVKPGKGEEQPKEDEAFPDLPEGADVELTKEFFGKLDALRNTYGDEGPHIHLDTLVVSPTAQRKGVGHALMAWGLAEADERGVPAFIEASEQGFGLYQKFGFVRTQPDLACGPNGVVAVTPMRRSPRKASQSAKVTVHRVSDPAELPTLAALARTAFSPYPTHRLTWADASHQDEQRWKVTKYTRSLEKANEHMFKAVDGRGEVVGFALWKVLPAHDGAKAGDAEETLNFPNGVNLELTKELFAKVGDLRTTYGNGGQYIHLDTLVVSPTAQRGGIGRALMAWGLAEADRLSAPVFLESTPEGYEFYERCGFVRTSEDLAVGAVAFTPMKRSPASTGRISIHRVTDPAELPSLAPVHRDAFSPYTMHRLIWGKVAKEDDNRWMTNSLTDSLANPREPIFKAVDEEGEVVGFALWKVPPRDGGEAKGAEDEKPMEFAEGTDVELAKEFFDKLDVLRKTYGDEGPHVHLNILVVSPKAQRKGVGRALIQWGCDEADRLGVPAWLEASEQGFGLYQKMGFERAREDVYAGPDNAISVTPMRRPPRPRA